MSPDAARLMLRPWIGLVDRLGISVLFDLLVSGVLRCGDVGGVFALGRLLPTNDGSFSMCGIRPRYWTIDEFVIRSFSFPPLTVGIAATKTATMTTIATATGYRRRVNCDSTAVGVHSFIVVIFGFVFHLCFSCISVMPVRMRLSATTHWQANDGSRHFYLPLFLLFIDTSTTISSIIIFVCNAERRWATRIWVRVHWIFICTGTVNTISNGFIRCRFFRFSRNACLDWEFLV